MSLPPPRGAAPRSLLPLLLMLGPRHGTASDPSPCCSGAWLEDLKRAWEGCAAAQGPTDQGFQIQFAFWASMEHNVPEEEHTMAMLRSQWLWLPENSAWPDLRVPNHSLKKTTKHSKVLQGPPGASAVNKQTNQNCKVLSGDIKHRGKNPQKMGEGVRM